MSMENYTVTYTQVNVTEDGKIGKLLSAVTDYFKNVKKNGVNVKNSSQ